MTTPAKGRAVRFDIPLVPPSLNELKKGMTSQVRNGKYKRIREAWEWALAYGIEREQAAQMKEWALSKVPVTVDVTIVSGRRNEMDEDNTYGGFKPCLDAMKRCGYLWDDSRKWVTVRFEQVYAKDPRTHRTVFAVEPRAA